MAVKSLLSRPLDLLFVIFFVTHIPITLFVDSQAVLPSSWYPSLAKELNTWYLTEYNDPLMGEMPPWFKALVWNEVFIQLPFFFVGAYAFAAGKAWIRKPAIVYGLTTATTLVPILGEFILSPKTDFARWTLVAFYIPYLIVPLMIGIKMLFVEQPFARSMPVPRKKKF
ncbi:hypothetical protein WJX72_008450 [[Myrmecia] bisecta]|uniref:EXPERA domain-containing protein n=1 Tax=[Myrmecia] bisecta TaxID=41462 RepID=A0AAW1QSR6_9CHLO